MSLLFYVVHVVSVCSDLLVCTSLCAQQIVRVWPTFCLGSFPPEGCHSDFPSVGGAGYRISDSLSLKIHSAHVL